MEVKASELRIGNWVNFEYKGQNMGNVFIEIQNFRGLDGDYQEKGNYKYSPITPTEDWLINFGFSEKTELEFIDRYFIDDEFSIDYNRAHKYYQFNVGYEFSIQINSIHQLQNLYYAISLIELRLNK
jgi:hypothetical protein